MPKAFSLEIRKWIRKKTKIANDKRLRAEQHLGKLGEDHQAKEAGEAARSEPVSGQAIRDRGLARLAYGNVLLHRVPIKIAEAVPSIMGSFEDSRIKQRQILVPLRHGRVGERPLDCHLRVIPANPAHEVRKVKF